MVNGIFAKTICFSLNFMFFIDICYYSLLLIGLFLRCYLDTISKTWIQYPKLWSYDNPLSQTFGILCLGNVHWVSSSSSLNLLSQITEETNFIDIHIDSLVILLFIGTAVVNWFGVNWGGGQKVGWGWFASVQQEQLGLFGSDMHWSWWIKFSIWLHGIRVG